MLWDREVGWDNKNDEEMTTGMDSSTDNPIK